MGLIALGTDKGTISVWDLKRGALAHSLGEVRNVDVRIWVRGRDTPEKS